MNRRHGRNPAGRLGALAASAAALAVSATAFVGATAAHADDYYRGSALPNGASGACLDLAGWGGAGTKVDQWQCNGGANQRWYESYDKYGRPRLQSDYNDLCLDINGGGGAGTGLIVWYCNDGDNQVWSWDSDLALRNTPSGLVVDDPGASQNWGQQMIVWYSNGDPNQQWGSAAHTVLT